MTKHFGRKVVWGWPSELKAIKGISPSRIDLHFSMTSAGCVRVNDGPWLILEDCGTHWQPICEDRKVVSPSSTCDCNKLRHCACRCALHRQDMP